MAGAYDLKKASNGDYFFNLKAGNGQIILTSQMYDAKSGAQNGIASVQANCGDDSRYTRDANDKGQFYFTLKAANHQVIGRSQMYTTDSARDNGIESVKTNGTSTTVNEE